MAAAHGGDAGDAQLDDARAAGAAAAHADQLLEDMDLRWQVDQLGQHLPAGVPPDGLGPRVRLPGQDPLGFAEAVEMMQELGDIDQLENLLRGRPTPGALAEVDLDRARPPRRRRGPPASSGWPSWPACSRTPASSRTAKDATS